MTAKSQRRKIRIFQPVGGYVGNDGRNDNVFAWYLSESRPAMSVLMHMLFLTFHLIS